MLVSLCFFPLLVVHVHFIEVILYPQTLPTSSGVENFIFCDCGGYDLVGADSIPTKERIVARRAIHYYEEDVYLDNLLPPRPGPLEGWSHHGVFCAPCIVFPIFSNACRNMLSVELPLSTSISFMSNPSNSIITTRASS